MRPVLWLTLLLAASSASADVLMPGYRGVSHEVRVEGTEAFPERTFVAYPDGLSRSYHEVKPDGDLYWKFGDPLLYAVPKESLAGVERDRAAQQRLFSDPTLPRSLAGLERVGQVPEADPRGKILTIYRIEAIEGATLKVRKLQKVWDTSGQLIEDSDTLLGEKPAASPSPSPSAAASAPPATPAPSASPAASSGGLCALVPAGSTPLLGLSAFALLILILLGRRRLETPAA